LFGKTKEGSGQVFKLDLCRLTLFTVR